MKFNSGGSKLGVLGFYAASHKAEQCGTNGNPAPTPHTPHPTHPANTNAIVVTATGRPGLHPRR